MSYSVASLANAIIKLEKDVASLANTRSVTYNTTYSNDLTALKSEFEKLNSMLGIIQSTAQSLYENGVSFDAWKQSSNVWKNVLEPLADLLFIEKQFQNGLTRTVMKIDNSNKRYAEQGGNTLCGDVFELITIHKNGLASNIIPNIGLPEMWNSFCNILAYTPSLGDSISTSSYAREITTGSNYTTIIQTGTIGGYQKYESTLKQYCLIMYNLTQSILSKISDIRIGGIGSDFGSNKTVAINQCDLNAGVSLTPYNTSYEIFNTVQGPLTVICKSQQNPFNNMYNLTTSVSSFFQFTNTPGALLGLYTNWNPFCPSGNILVHCGLGVSINLSGMTPAVLQNEPNITSSGLYCDKINNTDFVRFYGNYVSGGTNKLDKGYQMTYGKALGMYKPSLNFFDNSYNKLTYKATSPNGQQQILNMELYFEPIQGTNGLETNTSNTSVYGTVTGKIVVYDVGFNFVGYYSNIPSGGLYSTNFDSKQKYTGDKATTLSTDSDWVLYNENELIIGDYSKSVSSPSVLYQLGGYMYYA